VPWRRLSPLLSLGSSDVVSGTKSADPVPGHADHSPAYRWTGCVARTRSHIRGRRTHCSLRFASEGLLRDPHTARASIALAWRRCGARSGPSVHPPIRPSSVLLCSTRRRRDSREWPQARRIGPGAAGGRILAARFDPVGWISGTRGGRYGRNHARRCAWRPVRFEEVTSAIVANWGESLRPTDGPTPSLRSGQAVRRSDVVASLAPR